MAFFQKVRLCVFQISKSQKNIFQKTILNLKFKFQAQDSFLEHFFWRFGDLKKRIALSEKKPPLANLRTIESCPRGVASQFDTIVNPL